MLSRRAWLVLLGLFLLSLLTAAGALWLYTQAFDFPWARPGFGTPWEPHGPWTEPREPYLWRREPRFDPGTPHPFPVPYRPHARVLSRIAPWWVLGRVVASEVFFFLIGALAISLFPRRIRILLDALRTRGKSAGLLGIGFLISLLFVALTMLAAFSLIGLPFLPVLLVLFALAWGLGLVATTVRIGQWIRDGLGVPDQQWLLELAFGVLALFILGSIPILGALALVFAGMWGLGAVFATRFGTPEEEIRERTPPETGGVATPPTGESNAPTTPET